MDLNLLPIKLILILQKELLHLLDQMDAEKVMLLMQLNGFWLNAIQKIFEQKKWKMLFLMELNDVLP